MDRRGIALIAAAAFGGGLSSAAPAVAAVGCSPASGQRAGAAVRFAQGRYQLEAGGAAVRAALTRVAGDAGLRRALAAGNLGAAKAEATRLVRGHHHITAIRVVRGPTVLVETTRYPFDVAGAQTSVRGPRGTYLGTLEVTIQDVIGFIRLVHKFTGSDVVVRGAAGETKSSLGTALAARLPAGGCASVAGRSYAVRSFGETSFTGEQLTIWVLRAS